MPLPWKLIRLAGLAGVAATGVAAVRKHRAQREYDPNELRERLHTRLAEVSTRKEEKAPSGTVPSGRRR